MPRMLPFHTEIPDRLLNVLSTPDPVPEPGIHKMGVPLQTAGPRIPNPARSMLTLSVLTTIASERMGVSFEDSTFILQLGVES